MTVRSTPETAVTLSDNSAGLYFATFKPSGIGSIDVSCSIRGKLLTQDPLAIAIVSPSCDNATMQLDATLTACVCKAGYGYANDDNSDAPPKNCTACAAGAADVPGVLIRSPIRSLAHSFPRPLVLSPIRSLPHSFPAPNPRLQLAMLMLHVTASGFFSAAPGLRACSHCPGNEYSYRESVSCTPCVSDGAYCVDGVIRVRNGFWLENTAQVRAML